jgi:hypothetical protein
LAISRWISAILQRISEIQISTATFSIRQECRDPVADFADPDLAEWADPERDLDFREPEGDLEPEWSECAEPESEKKYFFLQVDLTLPNLS